MHPPDINSDDRLQSGVVRYLIEHQAEVRPGATCVRFPSGERWTFEVARDVMYRGAARLAAMGVARDDRVLIAGESDGTWLEAWWGTNCLGATIVAINPTLVGEPLVEAIADSTPLLALSQPSSAQRIAALGLRVEAMQVSAGPVEAPLLDTPIEPWDPAAINFTSGTTGRSRGVLTPYGLLGAGARTFLVEGLEMTSDDVAVQVAPLFHMGGQVGLLSGLISGAESVLIEKFRGGQFLDLARMVGATVCQLVGTMGEYLYQMPERPNDADNPLRAIALSPAPRDPSGFCKRFGIDRLMTGYGMTETGPVSIGEITDSSGTCGSPRPGIEVRIVDADDRPVPAGTAGELTVRAQRRWELMLEYVNQPEATATSWRGGWLHTGDIMRIDEHGRLTFVDRAKDYLRRRGENVSTYEVERAASMHPDVLECACVGEPDDFGGDEVKLFVVVKDDLRPSDLWDFMREQLPPHAVPRYIEVLDHLPRADVTRRVQKPILRALRNSPRTWDQVATGGVHG